MSEKICPIISIGSVYKGEEGKGSWLTSCQREQCELWVDINQRDGTQAKDLIEGHCGLIRRGGE